MKKGTIASLATLSGAAVGVITTQVTRKKKDNARVDKLKKMGEFYNLLIQWLSIRQEGKSLVSYFEQNGYKKIAIYGMKELGERLYDELKDSEIEVKYIIDKNADAIYADVDVVTPDDQLEEVDAITVTAIHYFDEIEEMLEQKVDCPVISLEDIVYEV